MIDTKNRRYVIALLLLFALGALWFWSHHKQAVEREAPELVPSQVQVPNGEAQVSARRATNPEGQPLTNRSQQEVTNSVAALIGKRHAEIEVEQRKGLDEWRTPIEFYGKVVDENSNIIAGAQIDFDCNDLSATGTSFYHAESDANGLFSIQGITGKLLAVKVKKIGHCAYQPFGSTFYYAGQNQNFTPDPGNPVIFRLKRKGVADPLIHIQAPMGGPKGFRVPKDGSSSEVSLTTGEAVPQGKGDLRVQCWTGDAGKARGERYDWKCQISVPNGGLLQSTNELDFEAPVTGYQSADLIEMPASLESGWNGTSSRKYFVKLASGKYARINFEMVSGGDHFFRLESFFNPSGSRNLEFDPRLSTNP